MSESEIININYLHSVLLRETENDSLQKVSPDLYTLISNFIGKLKSEDYDGIEAKVKNKLVKMITEITYLLLKTRLDKSSNSFSNENLIGIEKFILDSKIEMDERKEMILSSTLNGKIRLLESITKTHKIKPIAIRFLKEMDQIVGVDLEKYGPFKTEDVATIPNENAQALIIKNIATKISWED